MASIYTRHIPVLALNGQLLHKKKKLVITLTCEQWLLSKKALRGDANTARWL